MYQLKQQQIITHNIVSIYQSNVPGNSSFVKFGGWDPEAIIGKNESLIYFTKTNTTNTWNFEVDEIHFDGTKAQYLYWIYVNLNPSLPYMYIPDDHYNTTVNLL